MDIILVVLLLVLIALVALVIARYGKQGSTSAPALDVTSQVTSAVNDALSDALAALSEQARRDREESIRLASETIAKSGGDQLGTKAQVIDTALNGIANKMNQSLEALSVELRNLREKNNIQYDSVGKAVEALSKRTDNNSQKRGQWGERVVEDMLRAAGFIENVNYTKQDVNSAGGKPDYKFMMPPNRVLFMDVKFPLDKYAMHFSAETDALRAQARTEFVKAVRGHVDALAKRDYVNNAKEEAVDYVLMFLPNESISSFVHEADPTLIDYALSKQVVLCSPLALYAFLVVIRQATDSFHTEQTAASIMQQINKFDKEWANYVKAVDEVKTTFDKFAGKLDDIATDGTRFKKLGVPIRAIEKMRTKQGIPELSETDVPEIDEPDDEADA
jgi:DNA recombination protein RmuC